MAFLSQASHLGSLLLPQDAFQEHAAHILKWSKMLSSKGSERTCIRSGLATFLHCAFTAHADLVVTRGVSTGRGNLTLDSLYLSDGRLCNPSENRVNNINMLEVYHKIRGNLVKTNEILCPEMCCHLSQMCCQDRHVKPSASLSPHSQAAWRQPNKWVGSGYNL